MTSWQIIKKYYPYDLEIAECDNFQAPFESYPGAPLSQGSSGNDVKTMQTWLNRISGNFPNIPKSKVDGVYGAETKNAVMTFQKQFDLPQTGVVDKATWYKMSYIYTAVKNLTEIDSEGERVGIGTYPPTSTIRQGDRNADVTQLQFLLNYIGEFYRDVPFVPESGTFDPGTVDSVKAFQKLAGLTQDGVVGPATWQKLYDYYKGINGNVNVPPESGGGGGGGTTVPSYPGSVITIGSSGNDVLAIQRAINSLANYYGTSKVTEDGVFGPKTAAAVKELQGVFGLTQDGIVGRNTWDTFMGAYYGGGTLPPPSNPPNPSPSAPAYPGTSLSIGSRGDDVLALQKALNAVAAKYGTPRVAEDGVFGSGTQAAVLAVQNIFGLSQDGIVGRQTWDKVMGIYAGSGTSAVPPYPGWNLSVGNTGDEVKLLQKALNFLASRYGTPKVAEDGVFGSGTQAAVLAVQRYFGLTPDGIVGRQTWEKIMNEFYGYGYYGTAAQTSSATYPSVGHLANAVMLGKMLGR